MSASTLSISENGGSVIIAVTIDQITQDDVQVSLGYSGSATFNSDYSASGVSITIPRAKRAAQSRSPH